jgi:NADH-quinone oxidoreductase subunit L
MNPYFYTILIPLIPMVIFLITGLFGMKWKPIVSGIIGSAGLGISFVLSLVAAVQYFFVNGPGPDGFQSIIPAGYTWLRFTDSLQINMGVLLDPISVMMLVVITTVSFMVHVYSIGYMKGEKGFARFFSFL